MIIRDILNLKGGTIFSIAPGRPVSEAIRVMVENDIGSLAVTEGDSLAGMLTFREVLKALNARRGRLDDLSVGEVMVKNPICGHPEDSIDHLRSVMTQHHVRYLPVKEGERLVGIVSFHDVAKAVIKETSLENRLLRRYIKEDTLR